MKPRLLDPYLQDADFTLHLGDAVEVLRELPAESVHMCVTSPPFFGLRDYGTGTWEGGDPDCDHIAKVPFSDVCRCGARRVDRQIGLESSPDKWVTRLVDVFREVRRVLRPDGTLWLEIGDSYNSQASNDWGKWKGGQTVVHGRHIGRTVDGLKPKDLIGAPWLLAFVLRADGWYLRSDIIWARPNPMPESVRDRPTKSHSYVFLLSKSPRYFFDQEAVREPDAGLASGNGFAGRQGQARDTTIDGGVGTVERFVPGAGRNLRSVWTIATEPLPDEHYAAYPQKLVERCILAGTSERGCCPECGAPWERATKYSPDPSRPQAKRALEIAEQKGLTEAHIDALRACGISDVGKALVTTDGTGKNLPAVQALADEAREALGGYAREFLIRGKTETTGWRPTCECHEKREECRILGHAPCAPDPVPAVVLDPFLGSGTTALVARRHGRHTIGIELSPAYAAMAARRLQQLSLLA